MPRPRFAVLGGLSVTIDSVLCDLGTRKQRAVLAQLILADGDTVSADRLMDGIWGDDPPERAAASLQAYISGLRRTLEPNRRPRAAATVVLTRGAGYQLDVEPADVDVRRWRATVSEAQRLLHEGRVADAAPLLDQALTGYRPLLPEFAGLGFRDDAAAQLDRLYAVAREMSYDARLRSGDLRLLVTDVEEALTAAPLDEGLWAVLATARYRLGRQSGALEAIAQARRVLLDEVGVDPGPRLRRLEADILAHAPELDGSPVAAPPMTTPPTSEPRADPAAHRLIGRAGELAILHRAVLASLTGPGGIVIVEGEPGAGKTALVEEACLRARDAADVVTLWGRCVPGSAAPSMWPWIESVSALLPTLGEDQRAAVLDTDLGRMLSGAADLPDAADRFTFYDQTADLLIGIAGERLLTIVVDDLQWADNASLELLAHMASRRAGAITYFITVRTAAQLRTAVGNTLAQLARLPDHRRIPLGPLTTDEVGQIIRRETDRWPAAEEVHVIARRAGGNAFFVRELARLMTTPNRDASKSDTDIAIPAGVRDVVTERLRPLAESTRDLLDVAALIGSRVDLVLLADVTGAPIDAVLDALDQAQTLSLIAFAADDPFNIAFGHDLIREVIVEAVPAARSRRVHLTIADRLSDAPDNANVVAQIAHHLWAAAPLADRRRTATALLRAGALAVDSYRFDVGEQQLLDSARLARAVGADQIELDALATVIVSVVARHGYYAVPGDWVTRAKELAQHTDPILMANLDRAQFAAYSQDAEIATARRLATEITERARASGEPFALRVAQQSNGVLAFDLGEFGRAYRLFAADVPEPGGTTELQADMNLIMRGFHAFTAAVHKDVAYARPLFDAIDAGPHDPLNHIGAGIYAVTTAALLGEPEWGRAVGARLVAETDHGAFDYLRRACVRMYWWACAMLGEVDALEQLGALDEADIPVRTGRGLRYALHAEALLVAGQHNSDEPATDRLARVSDLLAHAADFSAQSGQHYPDAHRLLVEAKLAQVRGDELPLIEAILADARQIALDQEAHALVARIDRFSATGDLHT